MLTRGASSEAGLLDLLPPASALGGAAVDCCSLFLELFHLFAVRVYYIVCFVYSTSKRRYSASAAFVAPPPCAWVCGRDAPWGGEKGLTNLFAVYRLHTRPRGRGLCGQWPPYRAAASVPQIDELVCPYCLDRPGQHPRPSSLGSTCSTSFFYYPYFFYGPEVPTDEIRNKSIVTVLGGLVLRYSDPIVPVLYPCHTN